MHSKLFAALVLGLLVLSFVAVDVAGAAVSSSSSSTRTTSTIDPCLTALCQSPNPQNKTFNPSFVTNYFGKDIGTFDTQTAPNGFQWSTNKTDSLKMLIPTIGTPVPNSFVYFNSTHTAYQLSGPFGTVNIFFKQSQYNVKISIHANLNSPQSICLPFSSPNPIVQQSGIPAPNKTGTIVFQPIINAGNEVFDWSDIPKTLSPTWSSINNSLCISLPIGTTNIDPLALDGSGKGATASGSSKTCVFTTTVSQDVLIIEVNIYAGTVSGSVTDNNGHTFTQRFHQHASTSGGNDYYEYYSTWTSSGTDTITVTASATTFISLVCFGVSGASTTTPFDTNVLLPASAVNHNAVSITTSNANDILIVSAGDFNGGHATPATDGTWTVIQDTNNVAFIDLGSEYKVVSSTQSALSIAYYSTGTSNPDNQVTWADAIQQAGAPTLVQETTCTYAAQSSPTCVFGSSVTSGNIVYVIPSDSVAADTVSSVTDSGSNTYYFITRQNSLSTVGNVEGWYSITTTGGTLTVTVNLGISLTGAIIINEVGGARNDRPLSSIGTGTGTVTSVTSYNPDANSLVIGGLNSGCLTLCTVTAGTSYTLDDNAAVSTLFQASSEHITNTGTAETTPFALSASSGWNEISVAFAPPTSPVAETATLSQTVSVTPMLSRVFAGIRSLNAPISINAIVNMICPQADCIQRIVSGQIFGSFIIASIVIGFMMIGLMAARRKRR